MSHSLAACDINSPLKCVWCVLIFGLSALGTHKIHRRATRAMSVEAPNEIGNFYLSGKIPVSALIRVVTVIHP